MPRKKGFTLVELLIVVLILGALASIAIPRITASAYNAKLYACESNIDILNSQIELWAVDHDGVYPADLDTITSDPEYFPDGTPGCPLLGTYTLGANNRVVCDH